MTQVLAHTHALLVSTGLLPPPLSLSSLTTHLTTHPSNHHCRSCPYAERVLIALNYLGVPFRKVMIDMDNKPSEYVALYHSVCHDPSATVRIPLLIGGTPPPLPPHTHTESICLPQLGMRFHLKKTRDDGGGELKAALAGLDCK